MPTQGNQDATNTGLAHYVARGTRRFTHRNFMLGGSAVGLAAVLILIIAALSFVGIRTIEIYKSIGPTVCAILAGGVAGSVLFLSLRRANH